MDCKRDKDNYALVFDLIASNKKPSRHVFARTELVKAKDETSVRMYDY